MSFIRGVLNSVFSVFESTSGEDHTAKLPRDLKRFIASWLSNPIDLISLGNVNKEWRIGVSDICKGRIQALFRKKTNWKSTPFKVAELFWGPFKPLSNQLKPKYHKANPDKINFPIGCEELFECLDDLEDVDQVRNAIETLKNEHGVTIKSFPLLGSCLLDNAAREGCLKSVRFLIEQGVTHFEVSKKGAVDADDHFLINAVINGHPRTLRILLEHGASFNVDVCSSIVLESDKDVEEKLNVWRSLWIPGEKTKAFYEMFKLVFLRTANKRILLCVASAMRSWRHEVGIKAMCNDKLLSRIAGKFTLFDPHSCITKLFLTYGIVPVFEDSDCLKAITTSVINGSRGNLVLYSTQGLLDHQGFRTENGFTLADLALSYGQFELESFFVKEKGVPYNHSDQARELLARRVCKAFKIVAEESNSLRFQFETRHYDLTRLILIIDHYNIEIDIPDENGETPLFIRCKALLPKPSDDRISRLLRDTVYIFPSKQRIELEWEVIEALVQRRANLLTSVDGQTAIDLIYSFCDLYEKNNNNKVRGLDRDATPLYFKQKALEICRKTLGEDHLDTARGYSEVAMSLANLGRHDEALQHDEEALKIRIALLGKNNLATAQSYNNVGVCMDNLGRHTEALKNKKVALNILNKTLGEDHPDTVLVLINVSGSLANVGNFDEALPFLETALKTCNRNQWVDLPVTALSYYDLGLCLSRLGRHKDALQHHEKALEIRRKIFGESHPDTTSSYKQVGHCLSALCRNAEAFAYQRKFLGINRTASWENQPDSGSSYESVGNRLEKLGRLDEALPHHQEVLGINIKTHGKDHLDTAFSYSDVGCCFIGLGNYAQALENEQKALKIYRKNLGEDHPVTSLSYYIIGISLNKLDRRDEALQHHQKALENLQKALQSCIKILGVNHPDTASIYENVGMILDEIGRHQEAQQYKLKAQEIKRQIEEDYDPFTLNSLAGL